MRKGTFEPLPGQAETLQVMHLLPEDLREIPEWTCPSHNEQALLTLERDMASEDRTQNDMWRTGIKSLRDAAQRLDAGWPEGLERAETLSRRLAERMPQPKSRRRIPRWRDQGDELDLDRMYRQEYDVMWREWHREIQSAYGAVIHMAVQWGGNGHLSAKQIFWTGASAIALAAALDEAGYESALTLVDAVQYHSTGHRLEKRTIRWSRWDGSGHTTEDLVPVEEYATGITTLAIKRPGEHIRLEETIAACADAGLYRSLVFASALQLPWQIDGGFGRSTPIAPYIPQLVAGRIMEPVEIVVPSLASSEQALHWLDVTVKDIDAANMAALGEGR